MRPARQLNRVVLPAPFGPMSPVIDPSGTVNETPSTARWPPKALVSEWAVSISERTFPTGSYCEGFDFAP